MIDCSFENGSSFDFGYGCSCETDFFPRFDLCFDCASDHEKEGRGGEGICHGHLTHVPVDLALLAAIYAPGDYLQAEEVVAEVLEDLKVAEAVAEEGAGMTELDFD